MTSNGSASAMFTGRSKAAEVRHEEGVNLSVHSSHLIKSLCTKTRSASEFVSSMEQPACCTPYGIASGSVLLASDVHPPSQAGARKVPPTRQCPARPEVPMKPDIAVSKPRPPIPRKPAGASLKHGESNSIGIPVPEPRRSIHSYDPNGKQESDKPSPTDNPSSSALAPPLPRFPPNTPLQVVSHHPTGRSKPDPLRPRRSAPPVPPKKPASKSLDTTDPAQTSENKTGGSLHDKELMAAETSQLLCAGKGEKAIEMSASSRSYEQVFVEENTSNHLDRLPGLEGFHSVINGGKGCDEDKEGLSCNNVSPACDDVLAKDCVSCKEQNFLNERKHTGESAADIVDSLDKRETAVPSAGKLAGTSASSAEELTMAEIDHCKETVTAALPSGRDPNGARCMSGEITTAVAEHQEEQALPVRDMVKKFAAPSPSPGPPVRPKPRQRSSLLKQPVSGDSGLSEGNASNGNDRLSSGEPGSGCTQPLVTPVQDRKRQVSEAETLRDQAICMSIRSMQNADMAEPGTCPTGDQVTQMCHCHTAEQVSDSSVEVSLIEALADKSCAPDVQENALSIDLSFPTDLTEDGSSSGCVDSGNCKENVSEVSRLQEAGEERGKDAGKKNFSEELHTASAAVEPSKDVFENDLHINSTKVVEDSQSDITCHFVFGDVGETCGILKEIEDILNKRLKDVADLDLEPSCDTDDQTNHSDPTGSSMPQRPPRPKRANKLKKLSDVSYVDSSSTESLTSVGLTTKKPCPPKPKRKNLPGSVVRSMSDVSGMKSIADRVLDSEDDEKPFLPPRQLSLRLSEAKPPPLPPRNKSMERLHDALDAGSSGSEGIIKDSIRSCREDGGRQVSGVADHSLVGKPDQLLRSSSRAKTKKNIPRPARKAPPPPVPAGQAAGRTQSAESSHLSVTSEGQIEKAPRYSKISIDSAAGSVGYVHSVSGNSHDLTNVALDQMVDHEYHEIPEELARRLAQEFVARPPPPVILKEETPPPDLPPRNYVPQPAEVVSERLYDVVSENENVAEDPARDSLLHSDHEDSRPPSLFEMAGSSSEACDVHHLRPASAVSSNSSHSDAGSVTVDIQAFDQPSSSESEGEEGEKKLKAKREKKVFDIAEEVMKSETVFVDVLRLLNVDFRVFISQKTEEVGHPVVPSETLNKILDFLPQLQSFNEVLLKDLKERIDGWEHNQKISDIFVKKGPFLKLYSSYIRNFEHATALLDETCKKHQEFLQAVLQFERTPRCANLALKHYMLKPIQRIPQYKLLLQNYLNQLTPGSPDHKDTVVALNIVSEVADHANESMRHGDNVQKLLEVQRSLIGQFEVIQPGRVLIKRGELQKLSRKVMQPRVFFLFSDVLLYTTPVAGGYRLNNVLLLNGIKVVPPKLEEFKNEFNIISTHRSFTVAASTPAEREEWLNALWNAIEENSERYHTFKSLQQEPKNSLMDKDFVLGHKAPLWIPDARVTMCMLCMTEFSITWRRHHCRACGRIICGNCSENRAPLRYLTYKPARVCDDCFSKLEKEMQTMEEKENAGGEDGSVNTDAKSPSSSASPDCPPASSLSFSSIKARFHKIHKSSRLKKKASMSRPSVLVEVHANDEGSAMSGYLWVAKNKKWKRLWFVVKGSILYTYKASEDVAAIESMPLLGFEVTRMTAWYQGAEPDLMFELKHQNTQPLVFKSHSSTGGDAAAASQPDATKATTPPAVVPHVKSSSDTTTPRLIFRTDSAAATTKWVTVLREASLSCR